MSTLHPLAVHFPLTLALVWPLVDGAGLALGRPDVSRVGLALLIAALIAALFATMTGQAAYDAAIAAGHAPQTLDTHGDYANLVPWLLLAIAALRTAGVQKAGRKAHLAAIVAGLVVGSSVIWVGLTGGRLVYEQGVGVARKGS